MRMDRAQGQTAAMRLVERRVPPESGVVLVVPPQGERGLENGELGGVAVSGRVGEGGDGPADAGVVAGGDAEFFGVGLEVLVVVAALAAGVLDSARG